MQQSRQMTQQMNNQNAMGTRTTNEHDDYGNNAKHDDAIPQSHVPSHHPPHRSTSAQFARTDAN